MKHLCLALGAGLFALGLTPAGAQDMMSDYDTDADAMISADEFQTGYEGDASSGPFGTYDTDESGDITMDEFAAGEFMRADRDASGGIDADEYEVQVVVADDDVGRAVVEAAEEYDTVCVGFSEHTGGSHVPVGAVDARRGADRGARAAELRREFGEQTDDDSRLAGPTRSVDVEVRRQVAREDRVQSVQQALQHGRVVGLDHHVAGERVGCQHRVDLLFLFVRQHVGDRSLLARGRLDGEDGHARRPRAATDSSARR